MHLTQKKFYILLFLVICPVITAGILWVKVGQVLKVEKQLSRKQRAESLAMKSVTTSLNQLLFEYGKSGVSLSPKLAKVRCAKELGIVSEVRQVHLPEIPAAYNASIIEDETEGYHLFFRYDEPKSSWETFPFYSRIGYANLSKDFSLKKLVHQINTRSVFSEDPRVVRVGKELFLSWNDKVESEVYCRSIHSGKWDRKKEEIEYITSLDQHIQFIEKNWVPFERREKADPSLGFVYAIQPHKILDVPEPQKNEVIHLCSVASDALCKLEWSQNWGKPCGGSTARLVNGEYISFFHSAFKEENGLLLYVMGAYTFEAHPPHRITAITPCPIMFPGIYDSKLLNTSDPLKRVIFPAGIAVEKRDNKHILHVSCGENDCAIKVVTIDYEKLRAHMSQVKRGMSL